MIFRDVREDPCTVYGLYHNRQEPVFRRLPQSVAMQANEGVQTLHTNTAGGRVKFKTNSKTITIQCDMPSLCDMPHMPRCGSSGFDQMCIRDSLICGVRSKDCLCGSDGRG